MSNLNNQGELPNYSSEWCYDNPDIDDFDRVDHLLRDFFLSAKTSPTVVGNQITLLQVKLSKEGRIPFLLAGKDLVSKGIRVDKVEKAFSEQMYEVDIHLSTYFPVPSTLQLNACIIESDGWSEFVDSTQNFVEEKPGVYRFRFENLGPYFNGFFILMDPGVIMPEYEYDFEEDEVENVEEMNLQSSNEKQIIEPNQTKDDERYDAKEEAKEEVKEEAKIVARREKIYNKGNGYKDRTGRRDSTSYLLIASAISLFVIVLLIVLKILSPTGELQVYKECFDQKIADSTIEKIPEEVKSTQNLFQECVSKAIQDSDTIFLITNSDENLEFSIEPNLEYDSRMTRGEEHVYFYSDRACEFFMENKDSLGFRFIVTGDSIQYEKRFFNTSHVNDSLFLASLHYKYTEEIWKHIQKLKENKSGYSAVTKHTLMNDMYKLYQKPNDFLRYSELASGKREGSGMQKLFAVDYRAVDYTYFRFYFSANLNGVSKLKVQDACKLYCDNFLGRKPFKLYLWTIIKGQGKRKEISYSEL
jgi:hypothetical protein